MIQHCIKNNVLKIYPISTYALKCAIFAKIEIIGYALGS
ncbi:hypothetical protein [Acinetobacter bereziniae]|nr:hypothetical protein ACINWC743_0471 [Acinetobacter sp. WC-743]CEI51216.1 hypothetical protein [Acinetobacter bereziniae]